MPDFEFTVVEPFALRLDDAGAVRMMKVGDHISDPTEIKAVEESYLRHVARHYPRPAEAQPQPALELPEVHRDFGE